MKKIVAVGAMALILTGMFFAFKNEKTAWTLDKSNSKLGFNVRHLMISEVEGWFTDFDAKITTEKEDFSDAFVTMTAQVKSLHSENDTRDADLKSPHFLDAAKFPTITFKSKTFIKVDDSNYRVTGDLMIHGITKTVVLNAYSRLATHPMTKGQIAGFRVTGKIKRSDFGISPSYPVEIVGDEVDLQANVEFTKDAMP